MNVHGMKKRRLTLLAPALVLAVLAMPAQADSSYKNKYDDTTVTRDCGGDDTVAYAGPEKLWPPNHKLQDASVTATDGGEDGSDQTSLALTDRLDDTDGGDGGPNHDPDVIYPSGPMATGDPSATVDVQLRAERSGRGDGRTYTIDWAATFDGGAKSCTSQDDGQSPFVITVPHDMRGGADWK